MKQNNHPLKQEGKTVFITGGAGFIGSHLVDSFLKEGKQVIVYDNLSTGRKDFLIHHQKNRQFKLIVNDLLNISVLKNSLPKHIDLVIHLAANSDISRGIENSRLDFDQTIVATFNLLTTMKEKGIQKIMYFSGSGVYGDVGDTIVKENYGPLFPVSMYGASKLSAEALISAFSNLFHMQAWIFRPANIVGSRATHGVILDFIHKLKKNPKELLILGDGNQTKSYLHVLDVIRAVCMVIEKTNKNMNLFNISSTSYITVNEIADIVIKEMDLPRVKIKHTPGKSGWPGDVPIIKIDNSNLLKIGWKPKFNCREAVTQTVKELLKEN